jgi:hypothetical protein
VLNSSQLRRWFPDDDLVTVPDEAVTSVTDDGARRMLTQVGLPEAFLDVMELDPGIDEHVRTVEEIYQDDDERPPTGSAELLVLGHAGQPFLALDGKTGAVCQVHDEFGTRPLASSLEAFLQALGFVSEQVRKHQRTETNDADGFVRRLQEDTLRQLRSIDAASLPDAEPAWRDLLSDVAGNARE